MYTKGQKTLSCHTSLSPAVTHRRMSCEFGGILASNCSVSKKSAFNSSTGFTQGMFK